MNYYFAYGSNLLRERIEERVGDLGPSFVATLNDWVLCWDGRGSDSSGKCRIKPQAGSLVYGVIYPLAEQQFNRLDFYEGAPDLYYREKVTVKVEEKLIDAIAYMLPDTRTIAMKPPYDWYRDHVLFGAMQHQGADAWIKSLKEVVTMSDLDQERELKERKVHYLSGFMS